MTSHDLAARTEVASMPAASPARLSLLVRSLSHRYWLLAVTVLLFAGFSVSKPDTFGTGTNVRFTLIQEVVTLVIALALMLPMVCGEFDLSVGSIAIVSAVTAGSAMSKHHLSLGLAIVLALAISLVLGAINGMLMAVFSINSLIGTLGVSIVLDGLVVYYTKGVPLSTGFSSTLVDLPQRELWGMPVIVIIATTLAALVWYGLEHTAPGRSLTAIGVNRSAADLLGLRSNRYVLTAFVLSGFLGGIAGCLQLAVVGSASEGSGGLAILLPSLAAVYLGATSVRPGTFNVPGLIIGILFVAFGTSGLTLGTSAQWVGPVFQGGSLVFAVTVSAVSAKRRPVVDVRR